jgi:hypothetical protein
MSASRMLAQFSPLRHWKSSYSLDTADHLLRRLSDGIYVADVIATWASRYLAVGEQRPALPEGMVGGE